MEFECRITRSCIYWADDEREQQNINIVADSREEAEEKLYKIAMQLEFSTASKLVQDILIKIEGEWIPVELSKAS